MSQQRLTRRKFLGISSAAMAGTLLAACGTAGSPTTTAPSATSTPAPETGGETMEPRQGGQLTFGYPQITSYSHFMHLREYAGGEWIYCKNWACSRLVGFNRQSGYEPDLAESWELTNDDTTLVFNLRKDVQWHDGAPFTAADVEFTWMMMSMPNLGPYNKGRGFGDYVVGMNDFIDGNADTIEGLRVLDDYTVSFDLLEPKNFDVLLIPFKEVTLAPKHLLEQYLDRDRAADILQSEWATTANFVGTGPFRVIEYVPDQYVVYEPYENYHKGRPLLDRLVYRVFADSQTMAAALESGEIDCCQIPPTELERFRQMQHLNFRLNEDNPSTNGTPVNVREGHLSDKRVRQALLHAVDRQAMVDTLTAGAASVIHTRFMEPARFGVSPNIKQYDYNPDLARQLLAEAEADGAWDPNQTLEWIINSIPSNTDTFDAINGYWAEVGVTAEFNPVGQDLTTQASGPNWNFDFYASGYAIGHPAIVSNHTDALNPLCDYVCAGTENQRWHDLIQRSTQVLPDEEMQQIIWEIQEIDAEEAHFFIWYRSADVYGINKRVHDLKAGYTTMDKYSWDIHQTWVDPEA